PAWRPSAPAGRRCRPRPTGRQRRPSVPVTLLPWLSAGPPRKPGMRRSSIPAPRRWPPSRESAMSPARSLCLLIALSLSCLPACTQRAVRPSNAPAPPVVACEQGLTPDVPDWPEDWLRDGPPWAVQVLGVLTEERRLRAVERRCLADLRERVVIR